MRRRPLLCDLEELSVACFSGATHSLGNVGWAKMHLADVRCKMCTIIEFEIATFGC